MKFNSYENFRGSIFKTLSPSDPGGTCASAAHTRGPATETIPPSGPPNKEAEDDTPYSKTHFVTKIWKFVFVQGLFITYQETFISDGTYNT